ncbi:MAG: copper chaperone PCu(A)C [Pseudomonadota bacterium]
MLYVFRILFFVFLPVCVASAHEYQTGDLLIDHPHITKPLPGVKVSAGYVQITNKGSQSERLVGVTAEFAEKSQLHSVKIVDGIAKMRPVRGGIEIAPGETIRLVKGGFHLMFLKVSETLEIGQLQPVKLLFENAGIVEVEMVVVDPADLDHEDESASDDGSTDHSNHGSVDHSSHGD